MRSNRLKQYCVLYEHKSKLTWTLLNAVAGSEDGYAS